MTTAIRSAGCAAAILLMLPVSGTAQLCPDAATLTRDVDARLAIVRYLADDALEGRLAGSEGERCAGDFIASAFERIGLEPGGENGSWFQSLPIASAINPHLPGGPGRNVIAILRGSDMALRDEFIVVGAHYDHLGMGGFGSLEPAAASVVHNGADDNASGVAAMLAAAAELAGGERPRRSILFVAFTGEEMGLLGSSRFVASGPVEVDRMKAMLNLDMVGRLEERPLIVYGVDTATEWRPLLDRLAATAGLTIAPRGEGYGPSDHTSFYARDVPVLHFFTNVHGDYHRPGDDWDRIDVDGLERVTRLVASVAREVANDPKALTVVRGAGDPPATGEARSSGYGAWLGSIPDFAPVERGVLLSGVSADSPAERAGLRGGDILVGLGEHEVADLEAMTVALRAHRPGDTIRVRFLRDGREQAVQVTLGSRSAR
jgi:aminopeptidase YwaD